MPSAWSIRIRPSSRFRHHGKEEGLKEDNSNFLDARTIVAVAVTVFAFVGWQSYLQKKYPDAYKKKQAAVSTNPTVPVTEPAVTTLSRSKDVQPTSTGSESGASAQEEVVPFQSEFLSFGLSSKGMGLRDLQVPRYKDRKGEVVTLGRAESSYTTLETRLLGRPEPLDFKIERVNPNLFIGHASVGNLKVTKTLELIPEKYLMLVRVAVTGQDSRFVGLSTALTEAVELSEKGDSLLLPQLEKQEYYIETAETHDRVAFTKDDVSKSWTRVKLASLGSQYFTQAIMDKSPVMPEAKAEVSHKNAGAQLILQYPVLNPGQDFTLEYSAYVGPKSFGLLHQIDPKLSAVVDFGFFSWIARYIFELLHWFYGLVGNWGIAIICLTLVVRLCVLPFNVYSYKSMKSMQSIQPQIQALRERYKDDQQTQQVEMMKLMRENKVNPLGGCLPILLQFPIFIALYQVLGHSIELYQAPFGLWIHDLSLKDPYYILPVLMGITMFIQQKTTPNASMDPAQAKVLMMMPLIFTGFMLSLPSGLTLYMLVGAVFSVAQQTYFMKSKGPLPVRST